MTVAQAAQALGVSERTLRRLLKEPPLQARLQATERQGSGRYRQVLLLPPDLLADIQARLKETPESAEKSEAAEETGKQAEQSGIAADDAGKNAAMDGELSAGLSSPGAAMTPARLAAIYERLLAEKDARLSDQAERLAEQSGRIDFLEAALKREQEGLAREQSLRLLSSPTEPGNAEAGEPSQQRDTKKGWWRRFLERRRKDGTH